MSKRITRFELLIAIAVSCCLGAQALGQDADDLQSILVPSEPTSVAPVEYQQPVETPPPTPSPLATDDPNPVASLEELPPGQAVPQTASPVATPETEDGTKPSRRGPIDRTEARSQALGVSAAGIEGGVRIVGLIVDGAAARAGLLLGDIIQSINGTEVYSAAELIRAVASATAGKPMEVNIDRGGKLMAASVIASKVVAATARPAVPRPTTSRSIRRSIVVRTPGFQMESRASLPSGTASTRIRIAPPFPVPSVSRSIRVAVPAIRPPVAAIRPPIPRPPIAPPRFIRPGRRFGR